MALYADDIILYIRNLERSLPTLMSAINMYSRMSGYKLNIQKSEAMILGDSVSPTVKNKFNWKWDPETIKYLGIVIPKNLDRLFKLNFDRVPA